MENATIFLMSFWVSAQVAVNRVVSAPRQRHVVRAISLFSIRGLVRTRRKIPATTIVLECSRAETGVGPSMAEGSHGCSPNWADLPVAATMSPRSGNVRSWPFVLIKICCNSQELTLIAIHAMAKSSPTSPTRLYTTAWRAAVFASARPYHQPIRRKDMIPTPSQPIKS